MLQTILSLSEKFISIESVPSKPQALEEILTLALENLSEFTIERFISNGVSSALIYNTKKRPKKFHVILTGHLDVIPGRKDLYQATIKDGLLHGIGSMDMKANAACLIFAFKQVAKKVDYPLALQLVTDEQTGSIHGTKYQIEQGVKTDFVIAGETTNFNMVNNAKGVLWVKIQVKGKSAHSAYPWDGENAILKSYEIIDKLYKLFPTPNLSAWKTTINISKIETPNIAFNNIPDSCTISLDIRYIPDDKKFLKKYLKTLGAKDIIVDTVFEESALSIDKDNMYIKTLKYVASEVLHKNIFFENAHGTSDVTYYTKNGSIGIEFGPLGVKGNTNDESINIVSLEKYYQILTKFLTTIT